MRRNAWRGKVLRPAIRATALLFSVVMAAGALWALESQWNADAGVRYLIAPAGVAVGALLGLWGAMVRKPRALAAAALVMGATWAAQVLLLVGTDLQFGSWRVTAINATQFAAFLTIPGALFLGAAWAIGWRPSSRSRRALAFFAFAPPLMVAWLYSQGAAARGISGSLLLAAVLLVALALAAAGLLRDRPTALLSALALGVMAWAIQATRYVLLDSEMQVAVVSYVGPTALALAPLGLWLLSEAARPLAIPRARSRQALGSAGGTR